MPEVIIYHAYNQPAAPSFFSRLLLKVSKTLAVSGALVLGFSFLPSIWHIVTKDSETVDIPVVNTSIVGEAYQPRFNPQLPSENRLIIPSIGVDTQIQEATSDNYEEALKKGVWRVSDFGTPFSRQRTTILTAHKFGYLKWSNLFRRKNSFYSLPKLKEGEIVEIIWKQRKYVYKIYGTGEGEEIVDYSADLILYTCESLNSPVRIIKYAKLLEI